MASLPPPKVPPPAPSAGRRQHRFDRRHGARALGRGPEEGGDVEEGHADGAGDASEGQVHGVR